ncbi:MAG: DHHA1 domain-containing protein [Thermoproteota archaeon]|nr:DHHA1 domain-containing protein [Thermoproteota archaeon]MDQ4017419.1 DHHA1 domain-containing protein [Thermoproteota archaeon]
MEHKGSGYNTAFILIPQLDLDTVIKAEAEVNSLIAKGRRVTTRIFSSLEEAKREIPDLRANEERITAAATSEVKVVEIENHDVAACAMEHAGNLQECEFFLVTRLSKGGSEYEVDFVVGRQAKDTAVALSSKLLRVCHELRANINTVENTAQKLRSENEINARKLKALSREKLAGIQPVTSGTVTLLKGIFENLSDNQLQEFAGEIIINPNTLVLLANISDERANIVFARNEKMEGIDLNKMFKQFADIDGRGGGKPHFVTGIIKKQAVSRVLDSIERESLC